MNPRCGDSGRWFTKTGLLRLIWCCAGVLFLFKPDRLGIFLCFISINSSKTHRKPRYRDIKDATSTSEKVLCMEEIFRSHLLHKQRPWQGRGIYQAVLEAYHFQRCREIIAISSEKVSSETPSQLNQLHSLRPDDSIRCRTRHVFRLLFSGLENEVF